MQGFHHSDNAEDKSMKTANFADPTPIQSHNFDMKPIYTSNFAYHMMLQMQNPNSTAGLPYVKFLMDYVLANWSFSSSSSFAPITKSLYDAQKSFFVSIDFDRFNNRILALVRLSQDYCLINYSLAENKEAFYTIRSNDPLLFEAKYFSPYSRDTVMIIGIDRVYKIDLHEFDSLGPSIIDLCAFKNPARIEVPYNTPEIRKVFAISNATSVAISKGNSFLIFWSPFSKVVTIYDNSTGEQTKRRLAHFVDVIEFSQTNTEIVILCDTKKTKRMITVLNLKKGYSQVLDISSSMVKRECEQRKVPFIKNDDMVVALAGKADKIALVKNGCLLIFENLNYDVSFFDVNVAPMYYKIKTITGLSDMRGSDQDPIDHGYRIEAAPNSEMVAVYSSKLKLKQLTLALCVYDLNTNNLFKRTVVENLNESIQHDEYMLLSRMGDYPLVSTSSIYNKKYFILIKKPSSKQVYSESVGNMIRMFQIDGFQSI